jgi:EmrB/QacA subfamily drug resistance transporter
MSPVDEPLDTAAADAAKPAAGGGWIVPLTIGSAQLMQTLSGTILINALPAMAKGLDVDPLRLNLSITMYLLAFAVALPVSGWSADKLGAKRVFLAAMILFALSSAACGFAQNLVQLILARMAQGVAASMMMPVGRLVLLRTTPKTQLIGALAVLTVPAMFGPLLGPLIGGFIVTYWDWRWIFFINLPIAFAGVILVAKYVPNVAEREVAPLDWRGLVLVGGALAALIFGFENMGRDALPFWLVATFFAVAALCIWLYSRHQKRHPHPLLDLSIFRVQTYNTAIVGSSFTRIGLAGIPFVLAMLLQIGFGMSALQAGMLTFMTGLGSLAMKSTAPPLLRRFGFRRVLLVNGFPTALLMMATGLFVVGTPTWVMMVVFLAGGFFRSLQLQSFYSLTYADLDDDQLSRATTTSSMCMQLFQSIGVGLSAMLLHVLMVAKGESTLTIDTMRPVFFIMGGLAFISLVYVVRLPANAGAALSGVGGKGRR